MNKTRIMHLTFNMGIGGTEQVIRQLVTNLPKEQFNNQVVCLDGFVGEVGQMVKNAGVPVSAFKRRPGFDWSVIKCVRRKIVADRVDVVHCHQYTPWVYGFLASLGTGARVIMTEHGRFYPDRYRYKAALVNPLLALLTERIAAISSATKEALAKYEFIPRSKIQVVYNGIAGLESDPDKVRQLKQVLGIPENDLVFGTVARLDPVKNQGMMLEAFASVLDQHPRSWLLMVGDGPDRQKLEVMASALGIAERVIFAGFVDQPATHLAAMDLFLLTSNTEGTSMTLLEAMSLGIPGIVTNVGGNPEIVEHAKNGMLTPIGDAAAFSSAISLLAEQPEIRLELARQARKTFLDRFSVTTMVEHYSSLYLSETSKKPSHA